MPNPKSANIDTRWNLTEAHDWNKGGEQRWTLNQQTSELKFQHRHMGFEGTNPDTYIPMRYSCVVQPGLSPQTSSSSWEVSESWEDGEPGLREPVEEDPYPGFRVPWTLIAWAPHAKNLQGNRKPTCPNKNKKKLRTMSYKGAVASAPRELVSFRMSVFFPIPQLYFLKANLVGLSGEREREREISAASVISFFPGSFLLLSLWGD